MDRTHFGLIVTGAGAVAYGVYLLSPAWSWIVGGVTLVVIGALLHDGARQRSPDVGEESVRRVLREVGERVTVTERRT